MEDILRLFQDATGAMYDGDTYGLDLGLDLVDDNDRDGRDEESDIDDDVFHERELDNLDLDLAADTDAGDDDEDANNDNWVIPPTPPRPLNIRPCTNAGARGPVDTPPPNADPISFFHVFMDEDMFVRIAEQTNLYATQQQALRRREDKYWKEVTVEDIKVFIGINIIMGIHQLPEYSMYWSTDDRLRVPGVADAMGKNPYEKISQYFHLANSSQAIPRGEEGHDPLFKVRHFIETFRTRASHHYVPGTNLSIDEAMISYNGRLHFKQYIKGKPTPWGIKVWCIADPSNGYMLDIDVYTGKTNNPMPNGLGHHVIMKVGEKYLDKNHHFFFDNYFASCRLALDLLARNTYCCSTIRVGRKGWPPQFSNANTARMRPSEVRMLQKGPMLATVWNDKRKVSILSTNAPPTTQVVQRRAKGGRIDVTIPSSVLLYNSNMFGVDLADQLRSYYSVGRTSVKWWRYVFWFLVQLSLVNAWNLYKDVNRPHPGSSRAFSHLRFRLDVSSALTKGNVSKGKRRVQQGVATAGAGSTLSSDHQSDRLVGRKAACFWCSRQANKTNKGRTSETVYGCSICKIHLHKGLCFASFHQELGAAQ